MEQHLHIELSLQSLVNIFNRVNKSVISAIDSCFDIDIVNYRFESLRNHWTMVLIRYEKELESGEYNEQFINNVHESYERTEVLRHQYNKSLLSVNSSQENQLKLQRTLRKQNESRTIETQLLEEFKDILENMVLEYDGTENSKKVIMGVYHEYKEQLQSLQRAHLEYMCSLRLSTNNSDTLSEGDDWFNDIICSFRKINEEVREIIYGGTEN